MWRQLTAVVLEVSENVSHGLIGVICHVIEDICEILLIDCANDLLN